MNIAAAINLHSVATAVSGFCIPVFLRSQHKNVRAAREHTFPGGVCEVVRCCANRLESHFTHTNTSQCQYHGCRNDTEINITKYVGAVVVLLERFSKLWEND